MRAAHAAAEAKRAAATTAAQQSGLTNPVEAVLKVKALARDLGGLKHLKRLVDALAE